MKMRTPAALCTAAILPLALIACSSDDGDTTGEGLTELTIAVMPIVDVAPIYLGIEQGFFEDEGLELTLETQTGGAAAVPGVVAGDFDLAFGNLVSVMVARDQGLDLTLVAPASGTSADPDRDYTAVIVPDDSDIRTAADLAGARVSVNNLSNIGDTTIRGVVEADGGDASTIDFTEVPFPDVESSLANGHIDAGWSNDPFLTASLDDGYRVVAWNYHDTHPSLLAAGFFTTEATLEQRADVVDAFTAAMLRANEFATENPDEVRRVTGEYTEISADLREAMALPSFPTTFDIDAVTTLAGLAHTFGTLTDPADIDALISAP